MHKTSVPEAKNEIELSIIYPSTHYADLTGPEPRSAGSADELLPAVAQHFPSPLHSPSPHQSSFVSWIYKEYVRKEKTLLDTITVNLSAGVTVALVSVPLSVSLAIAADATPTQGIVTAFWCGMLGGLTGSSDFNIVGPTGALSSSLSHAALHFDIHILPILAILSSIIILAISFAGLQRFAMCFPKAVMAGFSIAVSVIIALNQINFGLGLPPLPRHESFVANVGENLSHLDQVAWFSSVVFAVTLTSIVVLSKKIKKVPWSIVFSIFGCIMGFFLQSHDPGNSFGLQTLSTRYGQLTLNLVDVPDFAKGMKHLSTDLGTVLYYAFSVALVSIIETLISAKIAQAASRVEFDDRREVTCLGLCNVVVGFAGGIPATAALARTALNLSMGATSRISVLINGVGVGIICMALFQFFVYLPLPIIAAILVVVAIRMINVRELELIFLSDKFMTGIMVATALMCLLLEPTAGILIGSFFSLLRHAGNFRVLSHIRVLHGSKIVLQYDASVGISGDDRAKLEASYKAVKDRQNEDDLDETLIVEYCTVGDFDFLTAESHSKRMKAMTEFWYKKKARLIINVEETNYIDSDGYDVLESILSVAVKELKMPTSIVGLEDRFALILHKLQWADHLTLQVKPTKRLHLE